MRAAQVEAGIVTNIIIVESLKEAPGHVECPAHVGIGMEITTPVIIDEAERIAAIKAEAGRRIDEFAPLWKQLNAERAGDADSAALFARIDAIRAASDALEVLTPIPDDYAEGHHWPA